MSGDVVFPSYRSRYLPAMTRAQIDALPGKASGIVIIPTGAIEQHGHHLPVGVDSILGQAWLERALRQIPASAPVYVGPAITYGKSNDHIGFPGTVTISARTLSRLLKCIARQVHDFGFRTLALLNTHGGNSATLVATLREIQIEFALNATMLNASRRDVLSKQEAANGFHAGQLETSLMLASAPHLVNMKAAVLEYPAHVGDPGQLRPGDAPATIAWTTSDISKSGVMGDATLGNAVDGEAWLDAGGRSLATQILALADYLSQRSRAQG